MPSGTHTRRAQEFIDGPTQLLQFEYVVERVRNSQPVELQLVDRPQSVPESDESKHLADEYKVRTPDGRRTAHAYARAQRKAEKGLRDWNVKVLSPGEYASSSLNKQGDGSSAPRFVALDRP